MTSISPPSSKRLKPSASSTSPPRPAGQQFQAFQPPPSFNQSEANVGPMPPSSVSPSGNRKRRRDSGNMPPATPATKVEPSDPRDDVPGDADQSTSATKQKRTGRTNTPWSPAEEQKLKTMRDAGNSWSEIAKQFPQRTEGSVKKHWYKDMHYAEFAEDESNALREAIREYEQNKWKVIGQKVGKPAKACEQYAKEHFKM